RVHSAIFVPQFSLTHCNLHNLRSYLICVLCLPRRLDTSRHLLSHPTRRSSDLGTIRAPAALKCSWAEAVVLRIQPPTFTPILQGPGDHIWPGILRSELLLIVDCPFIMGRLVIAMMRTVVAIRGMWDIEDDSASA